MNSSSMTLTALVASATFCLGLMFGSLLHASFKPQPLSGTAAQVNTAAKQDKEKTIVDLINENP